MCPPLASILSYMSLLWPWGQSSCTEGYNDDNLLLLWDLDKILQSMSCKCDPVEYIRDPGKYSGQKKPC